jgi:NADPH-dependent curcumin reductase CurA
VVVSTAAGAVGSAVGQIASITGCRTVGIAGGRGARSRVLDEFGYDAAFDYRSPSFAHDLAQACPRGIDIYFDNTSGAISDSVLTHLAKRARIVICGTASVCTELGPGPQGPRVERHLLTKSRGWKVSSCSDYEHRSQEAVDRLASWIRSGKLRYREAILEGLDQAPGAIAGCIGARISGNVLIRVDHG